MDQFISQFFKVLYRIALVFLNQIRDVVHSEIIIIEAKEIVEGLKPCFFETLYSAFVS